MDHLSPEIITGISNLIALTLGALGKHAWDKRQSRKFAESPSSIRLRRMDDERIAKLEHEIMDRDGIVRTTFHDIGNKLGELQLTGEIHSRQLATVGVSQEKSEVKIASVEAMLTEIRIDFAGGFHCSHCPDDGHDRRK